MTQINSTSRLLFRSIAWMWLITGCSCGDRVIGVDDGTDGGPPRPAPGAYDQCGNGIDDDENGLIDDGCFCGPAQTQPCYPHGLRGECGASPGTQTCDVATGVEWGMWGDCIGAHAPTEEACNGVDDDCDGAVDEGCPCGEGATSPCGEIFLGVCRGGEQTCRSGAWSTCEGAVFPGPEICGNGLDDNCNGIVDDPSFCECVPEPEICDNGLDDDCDGRVDEESCTPRRPDGGMPPTDGGPRDAGVVSDWCLELDMTAIGEGFTECGLGAIHILGYDWPSAVDADGNLYLALPLAMELDLGDGLTLSPTPPTTGDNVSGDIYLISIDPAGAVRWAHSFGLAGSDGVVALELDGDSNVYIAGSHAGRVDLGGGPMPGPATPACDDQNGPTRGFVASYTSAGTFRWARGFGGTRGGRLDGVAVAPDGTVAVAGRARGEADFGDGSRSFGDGTGYVALLNPDGTPRTVRVLTTASSDGASPRHIAMAPDGGVVVSGRLRGRANLGAGVVDSTTQSRNWVAWVARYTPGLELAWVRTYANSLAPMAPSVAEGEYLTGMRVDDAGNVYVTGTTPGLNRTIDFGCGTLVPDGTTSADMFMLRLSGAGTCEWSRRIGTNGFLDDYTAHSVLEGNRLLFDATIFRMTTVNFGDGPRMTGSGREAFMVTTRTDTGTTTEAWKVPLEGEVRARGVAAGGGFAYIHGASGALSLRSGTVFVCRHTL